MKITINTCTSHQAQIMYSHQAQTMYLLKFYLSIENSPKFTTNNIGVIDVTGDCANFHKHMHLCLKQSLIPTPKKKKKFQVIFRLKTAKNLIPSKPRKEDKLYFIQNVFYKEHCTFRFQNPTISIPLTNNRTGKRKNKTRQLK